MKLIERGVNQKELRFINRALRCVQAIRKKTNDAILRRVTVAYYPSSKRGGGGIFLKGGQGGVGLTYQDLSPDHFSSSPDGEGSTLCTSLGPSLTPSLHPWGRPFFFQGD